MTGSGDDEQGACHALGPGLVILTPVSRTAAARGNHERERERGRGGARARE